MSVLSSVQLVTAPGIFKNFNIKSEMNAKKFLTNNQNAMHKPCLDSVATEKSLIEFTINLMNQSGVDFGDLRLGRDFQKYISLLNTNVTSSRLNSSAGIGLRILKSGFWGFSSTNDLTEGGILKCVKRAVAMADAISAVTPAHLGTKMQNFAQEPAHNAEFHTPTEICPFETATAIAAEPLRNSAEIALAISGIKKVSAFIDCYGKRRWFASTQGARILTTHCVVNVEQIIYAIDNGTSAYRTLISPGMAGGLEHFFAADFPSKAKNAAQEALLKCKAPQPKAGQTDLILDGHHLALTIHESVGHPTELDRVLGYELNMAGGSFASIDKLGKFKYGSPLVNLTADNRIKYGGASVGFDDEGVECQKFPIVSEGILAGFGTNRETAHRIGQKRANGTARATSWYDTPIVRIPNLYLEPGTKKLSLDELIVDTKNGILMMGRDSFSIDQYRYNFQFGADMCFQIENGKVTHPLRDVIYQSITPDFWASCDAICDESEWQMHGIFNCGKGEPGQTAKMMHGASPSRFRNIQVGY